MVATLRDDASALPTVQKWAAELRRGMESLEDEPTCMSGRPATATTQENIDGVHHMAMNDRLLTVNQIAKFCGHFPRTTSLVREHSAQRTCHVEGLRSVGATTFDK